MMHISKVIKQASFFLITFPFIAFAHSSLDTSTQANNFDPSCQGAKSGKVFCKTASEGSKIKSCYPIFNQSPKIQLYYVLDTKPYPRGVVQPCKTKNEHFGKGVQNVEVVNLSNDHIIYNGEINNNVGLKCDESQCETWK
ncbi:hypothetical protein [Parashewanella tropica]|uniref:hypothetical protein n=1 Tax=Parashewanella tropica TaxID=2547970 RepID=UPI00105A7AF8|nr:hypothetical protein [Parashewanella tropica]